MKRAENLQPNMLSMIDFIMLLLIFFMVTAKFKGTEADILSLAYASNAEAARVVEDSARFVVNIRKGDVATGGADKIIFTVQGTVYDPDSSGDMQKLMNEELKPFRRENPKGEIVVRIDKDIEYRYVSKLQKVLSEALVVGGQQEVKVRFSVDVQRPR
jgi:biopolymer transport protein ExbD